MENPKEFLLCAGIFLGACLSVFAINFHSLNVATLNQTQDRDLISGEARLLAQNNRRIEGNPSARYTLVEFMDYECPPCRATFESVNTILLEFPETLRVSIHHFPLTYHLHAKDAALTAEAIAQQVDFSWIHRKLMKAITVDKTSIAHILSSRNINIKKFNHDYANLARSNVDSDVQLAHDLHVNATPTFEGLWAFV